MPNKTDVWAYMPAQHNRPESWFIDHHPLYVTIYRRNPPDNGWTLCCHALNMPEVRLQSSSSEKAKKEAIRLMEKKLTKLQKALESIAEASTDD